MAENLQIEQALNATAQPVRDALGNSSPLVISTEAVGIGVDQPENRLTISGENNLGPNSAMIELSNTSPGGKRFGIGSAVEGLLQIADLSAGGKSRLIVNADGSVGIGTLQVGKKFEVVGSIVGRESADSNGTAVLLAAEADGLGSLWTNPTYDPSNHTSGWKRTINLRNGNVGIGLNLQNPGERLEVEGNIIVTGDIKLAGADCAEKFDVYEALAIEPGTVMVIGDEETLHQCSLAYDKRVAGVISGAGECKPGMILGNQLSQKEQLPLALTGKVYCKVDAQYAPVAVGDLLTTSPSPGYAMKANDPFQAFGAVIGKAMRPLAEGKDLIPILIALQ